MTSPVKAMVRSSYPTELKPQIAQPDYSKMGKTAAKVVGRRSYEHSAKVKEIQHLMNQLSEVLIKRASVPDDDYAYAFEEEEEKPKAAAKVEEDDEDIFESESESDYDYEDDDDDEDGDVFEDEEEGKK